MESSLTNSLSDYQAASRRSALYRHTHSTQWQFVTVPLKAIIIVFAARGSSCSLVIFVLHSPVLHSDLSCCPQALEKCFPYRPQSREPTPDQTPG